ELLTFKVVGSIPYQITSPLVHKLLMSTPQPQVICLVIQKEVAQKIVAAPPRASYLSNFVGAFAKAKVVRWIKPGAFRPQPKVDSAIIKITPRVRTDGLPPQKFSRFLHRGFAHPRKMLNKAFPEKVLQEAGINPQARAQELELQQWLNLLQKVGG
ncbi:rRNA adenine N(6)-methyltransferase family protein, partial [Candidatus Parcubacteria bacterium]|nr:rRNA adenine N(6)-methyltransferase family protein [Candidatus Parcubacteria bacterium]